MWVRVDLRECTKLLAPPGFVGVDSRNGFSERGPPLVLKVKHRMSADDAGNDLSVEM